MEPRKSLLRRVATFAIVAAVIGGIVTFAPAGVLSQSNGGGDAPTPTGADGHYNCDDFNTAAQARQVYAEEYPGNVSGLDGNDNDGIPCEDDFPNQAGPVDVGGTSTQTQTATATTTPTATATETAAPAGEEDTTAAATQTATTAEPTTTATEQPTTTAAQGGNGKAKTGNGKAKSGDGSKA